MCAGNECRSRMAEGLTRHLKGEAIEPYPAGIEPHEIDPRAIRAMAEVGIDISKQESKHVDTLRHLDFVYVITLCDHAHKASPFFPAKTKVLHVGFSDPPKPAADANTEDEAMGCYRRVCDEIRVFVEGLKESLEKGR
ncbi:MAG: arsenate reductase ArsC [Syntrophobacteraceae bacterium]